MPCLQDVNAMVRVKYEYGTHIVCCVLCNAIIPIMEQFLSLCFEHSCVLIRCLYCLAPVCGLLYRLIIICLP